MMMKRLSILFSLLLVAGVALATPVSVLPPSFNGWQLDKSSLKSGSDPASADGADAPVLKEYGFNDFETGTYTRNGRKMQIKIGRFKVASGAYGAFT